MIVHGAPLALAKPCARPCEHVSLSVLTMRCAIPNTTETNTQRSLTEDPNPSTKWTQTRRTVAGSERPRRDAGLSRLSASMGMDIAKGVRFKMA